MLKIERKSINEHEAHIYINDVFFPLIRSFAPLSDDSLGCSSFTDFSFLSEFTFQDLIENEVSYVNCQEDVSESKTYYFYYSLSTKYRDPNYLDFIKNQKEETESINYSEPINSLSISLEFKYAEWKKMYSIRELQVHIRNRINADKAKDERMAVIWEDEGDIYDDMQNLTLGYSDLVETEKASTYLKVAIAFFTQAVEDAIKEMDEQYQLDIYSTYFAFPDEFKISCKQYLMYFSQFLLDLGIEVRTEIKDTLQGTFFSVIPQDKNEAIENIKQLLAEYMNAPNRVEFDNELDFNADMAVVQFQANVYHLKSQLAFARTQIEMKEAVIQAKDATIQSLNLINYQLSEKIQSQAPKDEENIIGGVVAVTKFEKAGLKINFPEIIRRLKRKWKG